MVLSVPWGVIDIDEALAQVGLLAGRVVIDTANQFMRWPELVAVADLASAQRAIEEILEQGEGPRGAPGRPDHHSGREGLAGGSRGVLGIKAVLDRALRPALAVCGGTHPGR